MKLTINLPHYFKIKQNSKFQWSLTLFDHPILEARRMLFIAK